jgi:hypothetical protein
MCGIPEHSLLHLDQLRTCCWSTGRWSHVIYEARMITRSGPGPCTCRMPWRLVLAVSLRFPYRISQTASANSVRRLGLSRESSISV